MFEFLAPQHEKTVSTQEAISFREFDVPINSCGISGRDKAKALPTSGKNTACPMSTLVKARSFQRFCSFNLVLIEYFAFSPWLIGLLIECFCLCLSIENQLPVSESKPTPPPLTSIQT